MANSSKVARIVLYVLLSLVVVVALGLGFAARYMLNFSLAPDPNRSDVDSAYALLYERFPDMKPWVDSVSSNGILRDTFVVMPSGERHHALYMKADNACGRTAVFVHGYKDTAVKFLYFARMYNRDLGYNVLLPELHAHGLSEGDAIQMGWKDADEVLEWIEIARDIFHNDNYPDKMIVHGVSMGAATTMNVSGKVVPDYVNAFIEDCGYTSVWDEFSMQLKELFGLPSFPLMNCTNLLCRMKYGWDFAEASPLNSVARCEKPMLLIHGDDDTFVPTSMLQPLYDAKPEPKQMYLAPGSEHARSYRDHPEEYTKIVTEFLEQWNK
ncbi:MAG: alpha/beta hydrolase [Bacteroidales bacterium]|nr:alpha/beta hydrolase [Bacteroidales bacterium]